MVFIQIYLISNSRQANYTSTFSSYEGSAIYANNRFMRIDVRWWTVMSDVPCHTLHILMYINVLTIACIFGLFFIFRRGVQIFIFTSFIFISVKEQFTIQALIVSWALQLPVSVAWHVFSLYIDIRPVAAVLHRPHSQVEDNVMVLSLLTRKTCSNTIYLS